MVEGNTRKPQFEIWRYDHLGNKMGYNDIWFKGSGNSYSSIYSVSGIGFDENDELISIVTTSKIALEFSEDGNSAVWTKTIEETGKETYTQNLELKLFKE